MKIILLIAFIIAIIIFIKIRFVNWAFVKRLFKKLSVFVVGKRGSGKDTLCSAVVYKQKNNSNCPYNKFTNKIKIHDILLPDEVTRKTLEYESFEKIDYAEYSFLNNITVISDAQINFPNFEDSQLKKEYKSLPISYQVWRHLFDAGLHFNTQIFSRIWKLLREQVEDCIKCCWCVHLPFFSLLKLRYYENADDCEKNLKPIKHRFIELATQEIRVEESRRGLIKEFYLLLPNRKVTHDSRFYRKIIFTEQSLLLYDSLKKKGKLKHGIV